MRAPLAVPLREAGSPADHRAHLRQRQPHRRDVADGAGKAADLAEAGRHEQKRDQDPADQRGRFEAQAAAKDAGDGIAGESEAEVLQDIPCKVAADRGFKVERIVFKGGANSGASQQRPAAFHQRRPPDLLRPIEGGQRMRDEVAAILKALGKGPFIFNLAHGVLPQTPPAPHGSAVEGSQTASGVGPP